MSEENDIRMESIEEVKKPKMPSARGGQGHLSKENSIEMERIKKRIGIIFLVAFSCISFGLSGAFLWSSYFPAIMKKELVLTPNSTSYGLWKETPVPMYLKVYLYNWTNYDEVMNKQDVKPHFVQMGPYVFREIDYKVNKTWNNNNGTITFYQKRIWHFLPLMSNGSLTDNVTNLNPVAATIAYSVRASSSLLKPIINKVLQKVEKLVITKSVQEVLFDGYDDILLKLAVELNLTKIPFEKFAWFYSRNNSESYDGIFNMLTGVNDIQDLGIIQEWKYENTSPYYSNTCGKIKGTNGDLWPPLLNNKTVSVFSPDICTTLNLKAAGKSEWLGLTGSKFVSDEDMLDNGTKVESRKCYCAGVDCQPSGTLNVSSCKYGAPAFVSLPHFYLADNSYRQNISGMNPKKEDHEFLLVVQPDTGLPMQVRAALQLNFLVQPDEHLTFFKDFPKMYVPMLWFTQEVNLTSQYANQVKLLLILPSVASGLLYFLVSIGIALIFVCVFLYVRQRFRDEQNEILVSKDDENSNKEEDVNDNNQE